MPNESTSNFLRLMHEANKRIAEHEAKKTEPKETGTDPIREQRQAERRERWGQLRAREHPSRRPKRARVMGVNLGQPGPGGPGVSE
jgi:hypothetical protein